VDFVEKKEETLQLIVLGRTKTKNSLGNGGGIVWHKTPKMRDRKYLIYYQMTLDAFNVLVEKLTSFLKFECLNL